MNINNIKLLRPQSTIGIIGGGQLGRMLAFEGKRMGYNIVVLDPKASSPAGQVSDEQILAEYDDSEAMLKLAEKSDVLTYEFEHISTKSLKELEKRGYKIYPGAKTLECIQNKFLQKTFLKKLNIKVPDFVKIDSFDDLNNAYSKFDGKLILKTCTGGYDGKGNIVIKKQEDLEKAYRQFEGHKIMAEEYIGFIKEVSVLVARSAKDTIIYPVAENIHKDSILVKSLIPADIPPETEKKIGEIGSEIVDNFNDFGIFCIEFFVDKNMDVLVNEIAPRPHNSGHYTIEGCVTSQYEQLLRILTGMPLGSASLRTPCAMYNILGDSSVNGRYEVYGAESVMEIPDCHLHLYGKPVTHNNKKLGHITALGKSIPEAQKKCDLAAGKIRIGGTGNE